MSENEPVFHLMEKVTMISYLDILEFDVSDFATAEIDRYEYAIVIPMSIRQILIRVASERFDLAQHFVSSKCAATVLPHRLGYEVRIAWAEEI